MTRYRCHFYPLGPSIVRYTEDADGYPTKDEARAALVVDMRESMQQHRANADWHTRKASDAAKAADDIERWADDVERATE